MKELRLVAKEWVDMAGVALRRHALIESNSTAYDCRTTVLSCIFSNEEGLVQAQPRQYKGIRLAVGLKFDQALEGGRSKLVPVFMER